MTIHLDTSALIAAVATPRLAGPSLRQLTDAGDAPAISTPVLFEWLRGPRTVNELRDQQELVPESRVIVFDAQCARTAARLYRQLARPRHRALDIAIAACAIEHGAPLWTLNVEDFSDIPGLRLYVPTA